MSNPPSDIPVAQPAPPDRPPSPKSGRSPLRAAWRGLVGMLKGIGWIGVWLPGALIALLLGAVLVFWWWSATPGSLAQTITWAQEWLEDQPPETGRLQATGVQGSLWNGGEIEQLQWSQPGLVVNAQAVRLRWSQLVLLNALRGRGVQLEELAIGELRLKDERPPTPTEPMESLTLPVGITLPWSVGRFVLEGESPLELTDMKGLYRYGTLDAASPPSQGLVPGVDAAHQITLDSLQVAQGRYRLQAVLGAQAPMPLRLALQGEVKAEVPGGESLTLAATADVTGTLSTASATLDATAQVMPQASASGARQNSPTLQATARLHPWASQPIEQVNALAHQLNLAQLWPQAPLTALSGTLQAQPNGGAWQASARFTNSASGPWDQQRLPFEQLQAAVEQRGSRWVVPQLKARIGRAELVAQGAFDPATENKPAVWEGSAKTAGLNPALIWSTLSPLALDADLSASTAAAAPDTIAVQARILPSASQPARANQGVRLREVRLQGQWLAKAGSAGVFDWQQAVLDAADLRLTSQGRLDVASKAFKGSADLKLPGAQGTFKGEVAHAQGAGDLSLKVGDTAQVLAWVRSLQTLPVAGPAIRAWLQDQPALRDLQAKGQMQLNAQWQGGLAELGFPGADGKPRAAPPGRPLQLQVALDVPQLEVKPSSAVASTAPAASSPTAPPGVWSVNGFQFKANGSLADLALSLQGEAAMAPWRGDIKTQARLKNALAGLIGPTPATARVTTSRLELSALQVQLQDASRPDRRVDWQLRSQQPLALSWTTTPTGLNAQAGPGQLTLLPSFKTLPAPEKAAGKAAPKTSARITPNTPSTQAMTLAWDSVRWQANTLQTRGRLRGLPLSWLEALATAEGNLAGPLAQLGVLGDVVFDGDWDVLLPAPGSNGAPLRLTAQLQRSSGDVSVQTEPANAAGQSPRNPRAPVQAGLREARLSISAQGNQVKASLRWNTERLGQASADVSTEFNASGQAAAGTSALDTWWPASSPITGTLQAALPQVGMWSALAPPGWRMRGTLKAEAAISGTRGAPKFRGSLEAEEVAVRSVVDGIEFSNGRLRATLEEERITIERLTLEGPGGAATGGRLDAKGQAQWRAASAGAAREPLIDLEVNADKLRVSTRPDRRLSLSGQIKAQLAGPRLQIRGKLTTDSALFLLPDELAPTLGDDVIVRGGRSLPTGTATAQVEPDVEVVLNLGNQFEVNGRGLKTRLSGEITVRATPTSPTLRVLGEVRTMSGTFRAYGQNLAIESGVLRFTGPYDDPTLDIVAIRPMKGEGQRVGVQISGSAQAPRVALFSDPELPDSEKLAWLVLGRPATGAGAEAAVLQQAAMALLAGKGGQDDGGIASMFGLDELGVSGETTNADGSTTAAALTLGKQISDKLYLSYERTLAGTLGTVSIFYDLSRRLTLRARAGEESAIDLIFTIRYD